MTTYLDRNSIRTITEGIRVARATDTLPQTADEALFRVTGRIRVVSLIGEVTTVVQTQADNTKLKFNPAGTGADVDLCAVLDITADAVGTLYSITGTAATAMQSGLWVLAATQVLVSQGLVLQGGDIELDCAASNTGSVAWELVYTPLSVGASVAVV